MKTCSKCKVEKEETEFTVRKNTNNTDTVYLKSTCKACAVEHTRVWRTNNFERYREYQNSYQARRRVH